MAMPENGTFCWNELITNDVDGCKKFYAELLGWKSNDSDMGGMIYTVFKHGETMVGGMMKMTKEMGDVPPHWLSYIAVNDIDAKTNKAKELGAEIIVPPTDIPTVGRFAVICDPGGAAVAMITLVEE